MNILNFEIENGFSRGFLGPAPLQHHLLSLRQLRHPRVRRRKRQQNRFGSNDQIRQVLERKAQQVDGQRHKV